MQAKLTTPHAVDAVVSPELLRRFESSIRRRLTVVSAPAGYGKTTVTVAALRALRIPHVWYRVDVLDHDPAVTILSLCEGLRRRRAGFGGLLRERLLHPSESPLSAEDMAAAFVVAAQEDAPEVLHLVIDDYHEATGSREFNRMLDYLIDNLPHGWRLIVLGRYEPGFGTAKLKVGGGLGSIGADDLRLDAGRVHELLLRHVPGAAREQAERLAELTEGWPAAVSLAAETLSGRDLTAVDEVLTDPRLTGDIYAYVAEQVYRRERPDVRRFLKRTCDLDALTPEIANRVADVSDAHRYLEHLARNRIFTFKIPRSGSYRYHPLFRDYLREACLLEDGPEACRERRLHSAAALEECGEIERSVELLIAAAEPELALGVVARQGEAAFGRHRAETLDAWLARLPLTLVETDPWAQLLNAHRETRDGRYEQALQHIDTALATFRRSDDTHGLYSALSARERALFWQGDPSAALDTCREALSFAESDEHRLHTYASMLSAAVDMGDWTAAEAAQRESQALAAAGPPEELLRIRALHASALFTRGRYFEACNEAGKIDVNELSPFFQPVVLGARATICYALGEYSKAANLGSDAAVASEQMGHQMALCFCRDIVGFVRVLRDGSSDAVADIEEARVDFLRLGDRAAAAWPTVHIGTYHRRRGDLGSAASSYRDGVELADAKRDMLVAYNARANLAFTLGLSGDSEAPQRLSEIEIQAAALSLEFVRHKAAFFRGCLDLHEGRDESGLSALTAAVRAQVDLGHISFVGRELITQRDVATKVLREMKDARVVGAVADAMARHTDSLSTLTALATLGETHALAALEAAGRWREEDERASLARSLLGTPFRRARQQAAELLMPAPSSALERVRLAYGLTRREAEVLSLIAKGLTNHEIEATLHISHGTLKTHVNHIFTKLEVTDRVGAVLRFSAIAAGSD